MRRGLGSVCVHNPRIGLQEVLYSWVVLSVQAVHPQWVEMHPLYLK